MSPAPSPSPIVVHVTGSDWPTLAIAVAAFLVAIASLYLSNLRRANIELIELSGRHRLIGSGTTIGDGKMLADTAFLYLSVSAYNRGARAGVLVSVRVDAIREEPETPRLFEDVAPQEILWPPKGVEGGDAKLLELAPVALRPVVIVDLHQRTVRTVQGGEVRR